MLLRPALPFAALLTLVAHAQPPAAPEPTAPTTSTPPAAPAWTKFPRPKSVPIQASSVMGSGPQPLVLITDLGPEPSAYDRFAQRHATVFTTHTLAMPGSTKDARGPQLHRGDVKDPEWLLNAADAVAAYIRENNLKQPIILGHGIGGMVGYMLAITQPDLAQSYVVVNMLPARTVGGPGRIPLRVDRNAEVDRLERGPLMELKRNSWLNQVRDTVPSQCLDPKFAEELVNMYSRVSVVAVRRYRLESLYLDLRDDLDTVQTPMLVVLTVPDWFPRLDREVLKSAFLNVGFNRPNVTVEILENVRGWGIIESPDRFDPPLLKFLGLSSPNAEPQPTPQPPPQPDPQPEHQPEHQPDAPGDKKGTP